MSDVKTEALRRHAKRMRLEPTEAERKLWYLLRARRFSGFKFRRQVPIGPYIVDFVCFEHRLIIEADGSQHAESPGDVARDAWFVAQGFRVRRFWNVDILARPGEVADTLWEDLGGGAPSSGASRHLLPQGEKEKRTFFIPSRDKSPSNACRIRHDRWYYNH